MQDRTLWEQHHFRDNEKSRWSCLTKQWTGLVYPDRVMLWKICQETKPQWLMQLLTWFKHTHTHPHTNIIYVPYIYITQFTHIHYSIWLTHWCIHLCAAFWIYFECNSFLNAFAKLTTCWRIRSFFTAATLRHCSDLIQRWKESLRPNPECHSTTRICCGNKNVFYVFLCLQVLLCTQTHDF